jgi:hypothetical protein
MAFGLVIDEDDLISILLRLSSLLLLSNGVCNLFWSLHHKILYDVLHLVRSSRFLR